jgi:hypothetical protein
MQNFLELWGESAFTTAAFFWMALWAFVLGYIISSAIQVFVTRERMQRTMGEAGSKSVALGTFFGFISSSCSFAALSTTRALFKKGAGLIPSLAFLLASTNLVIELGFVIAVFLSWQFVVGEYLGGILLILIMWVIVKLTKPQKMVDKARERVEAEDDGESEDVPNWKKLIRTLKGWHMVAKKYFMEWAMVWKDVTIGFTVAGIISAMVPRAFFETLFVGSGSDDPAFWQVLLQTIVGPVAAFFTFIGSMGNIPLAGVLYGNGVAFAGIMAFIFSDLVVFPIIRIHAQYYGWKMALYIAGVFLAALVGAALLLHYGFELTGFMPEHGGGQQQQPGEHFALDYTFFFNLTALVLTGILVWLAFFWKPKDQDDDQHGDEHDDKNEKNDEAEDDDDEEDHDHGSPDIVQTILKTLAYISYAWLLIGLILHFTVGG